MERFERHIIRLAHKLSGTKESDTYLSWIQKHIVVMAFVIGICFASGIYAIAMILAYFLI